MRQVIAALALVALAGLAHAREDMDTTPLFGATLSDLNDRPAALSALKGKALIVNFWARWCSPCRTEIPLLSGIQRRNPGVKVIGIAIEDQAEAVKEFSRAYEIPYALYLAKDQGIDLLRAMGDEQAGLPYTLGIDRAGKVVFRKLGPLTPADMKAALARLR